MTYTSQLKLHTIQSCNYLDTLSCNGKLTIGFRCCCLDSINFLAFYQISHFVPLRTRKSKQYGRLLLPLPFVVRMLLISSGRSKINNKIFHINVHANYNGLPPCVSY